MIQYQYTEKQRPNRNTKQRTLQLIESSIPLDVLPSLEKYRNKAGRLRIEKGVWINEVIDILGLPLEKVPESNRAEHVPTSELLNLWREHHSSTKVAQSCGLSLATVQKLLKSAGVNLRDRGRGRPESKDELEQELRRLGSVYKVAEHYDCDASWVWREAQRCGLDLSFLYQKKWYSKRYAFITFHYVGDLPEDVDNFLCGKVFVPNWHGWLVTKFGRNGFYFEGKDSNIWHKGYGFITAKSWRVLCSKDFLEYHALWSDGAEWMTSGTYQLFKKDAGFVNHINDDRYQKLLAQPMWHSRFELELYEEIRKVFPRAILGARVLPWDDKHRAEIDIYVPEKGLGFELNGSYWHSEAFDKFKGYHTKKTEIALERGIRLYHYWPDAVDKQVIKSSVWAKLGLFSERFYARDLEVREGHVAGWFNSRHIHGGGQSTVMFGLYQGDRLISLLSLWRNPKVGLEISRYATESGCIVVGGFAKLMNRVKEWMRENNERVLISYADRDTSPNYKETCYYRYGFSFLGDVGPIMWGFASKTIEIGDKVFLPGRYNRRDLQKCKLGEFEESEESVWKSLGITRIWNSGNLKFQLSI